MSVVGIDFGTLQSVIAVARNRGIDVITNEVSNRATPSLVSFGKKQRYIGEAAKTQEVANFRNTVGSLVRLIGRPYNELEVHDVEARHVNAPLVDVDGEVAARVHFLGKEQTFTSIQLVAMYLGKLKDTAQKELRAPVTDVVVSVPSWFTDRQRRAMMDAISIAGLNCLRLMNDITSSALAYGITKTDLPESKPRHVVLVDVGHAHCTVAVVAYKKGELKIKSTVCDRHLGGRDFDELLVDFFAKQIKEKHHLDVKSNSKALLRLRVGCEKLKKILSANLQAPLNVESIMNDQDIHYVMKRSEFEELTSHIIERVDAPLRQALQEAELEVEMIDAVELIGGSTRIPAIKERLQKLLNKELSTTLNQDEAVARGCALQCAILSPAFRVREFAVQDLIPYPVKFCWQPVTADSTAENEVDVFVRNNVVPSTKILTFFRKEPFEVEAVYTRPDLLPKGMGTRIGHYILNKVKPIGDEELATVKVKARVNLHGIVGVEGAYIAEEIIREEEVPMEIEGAEGGEPRTEKKIRKSIKKHELPVVAHTTSLDAQEIARLTEAEAEMRANDKLMADTEEAKNALEEYVYELRDKLDMQYGDFVMDPDREKLAELLRETENWLYAAGENATKSVYLHKLEELKQLGEPIAQRYRNHEELPKAESALRETINQYRTNASSPDDRFAHISEEDKDKVKDRCRKTFNWLDSQMQQQAAIPKTDTPVLWAHDVMKEREQLVMFCSNLLSKPKPKEPAVEARGTPQPEDVTMDGKEPKTDEAGQGSEQASTAKPADMDID